MFGVTTEVNHRGDHIEVSGFEASALLDGMPLPYPPPGRSLSSLPEGFDSWWRKLWYAFDLPNPSTFPYVGVLSAEDLATTERFVTVTEALAVSAVVNSESETRVDLGNGLVPATVEERFPALDAQAGFASLLRQCHAQESGSYSAVRRIMFDVVRGLKTRESEPCLAVLSVWRKSEKELHNRSLHQIMYDRFFMDEQWPEFNVKEAKTPDELLRIFNYGDLIHWGRGRDQLETEPLGASQQRMDFLRAALGLTHFYIGFGVLVRAATTSPDSLLTPA
jgi:hypothetical protein